jgi:hypothetical protein
MRRYKVGLGVGIMIDEVKHYFALRKLQAKRRKLSLEHDLIIEREVSDVTTAGSGTPRALRNAERELEEVDNEIAHCMTMHLFDQAEKYLVFWPKPEGWLLEKLAGFPRLSLGELTELRVAIRKERKERWEQWQMRLTLLIGLMGTAIGLVSLLVKK